VPIDRRTLLKYGLAGTAVLAVGGVGLALRPTLLRTPATPLQTLSEQEFSILAAFSEAVLAGDDSWPDPTALGIAEEVDGALALLHPGIIGEIKQVLALLESALAGALLDARLSTFTSCSLAKRCAILESWRSARTTVFRVGFAALQGFVVGAYYNRPGVGTHIGYPGVPAWVTARRLQP